MNINLEYYKIFYHVAKLGSITQAADILFVSQPAVSRAIKLLEAGLGAPLFIRTQQGVILTPEGEVLFSHIARGYESIKLGESKFQELLNLDSGELRIGASDMTLKYYLLPYLEEFHHKYPKINVKVTNAPTPVTVEYLESGKIDFGVVTSPLAYREGFITTPVRKITDIFIAGSKFEHLRDTELSISALSDYPIICLEKNTSTRAYVDCFLQKHGVSLSPEFDLATSDLIVSFTLRNLGIGSVVSDFAAEEIEKGRLFKLKFKPELPPRDICITVADKISPSPAGKKLLEMLI